MTKTKTRPMTITELSRVTGVSGASITVLRIASELLITIKANLKQLQKTRLSKR